MSTYAVRNLRIGAPYGRHLTARQAAAIVLRHATRRYAVWRTDEGYYWLRLEADTPVMEIAYNQGRPIGAWADTSEAAWTAIASQIVEAEWPGLSVSSESRPSLRLVWNRDDSA